MSLSSLSQHRFSIVGGGLGLRCARLASSSRVLGRSFAYHYTQQQHERKDETVPEESVIPIWPVKKGELEEKLSKLLDPETKAFAMSAGFAGEEGQVLPLPSLPNANGDANAEASNHGSMGGWLFGVGEDPFAYGALPQKLPPGLYKICGVELTQENYLGWGLGSYTFRKYKQKQDGGDEDKGSGKKSAASAAATTKTLLCVDDLERKSELERVMSGIFLGRNLINTPCSDLGPEDLAQAAEKLGKELGAQVRVIRNAELEKNFPLVHAVGRAAAAGRGPLVVDMNWGRGENMVTLVGKGVCFDTGGLDIKPPSSMATMKKDMGGAGAVLSLASMIMASKLDVKLRVLIPCVENCVAGNAFRPSDVIKSRSGLTVEIGNTDAEGRLILADCLTLATEGEEPDLILDMATLTGAHRVALGWDLPGIFTDNEELAQKLYEKGMEHHDPVWRLPLWKPYAKMIDSKIADMNNIGSVPWGGAITAALFLQKFVNGCPNWVHIDFNGWTREKPGFPEGGEPQAVRGIYEMLKERYGTL